MGGWEQSKATGTTDASFSLSPSPIHILSASLSFLIFMPAFFGFAYNFRVEGSEGLQYTVFESGPSSTSRRLTVQPA